MAAPAYSVLITTPSYAPELTGVGRYTGELAVGLAVRGAATEVVCPPPHYPGWYVRPPYSASRYAAEWLDGVRVWRCPIFLRKKASGLVRLLTSLSFGLTASPVLVWRILSQRPDVVLCVEPTLATAPTALLAAWLVGARTVLHVQDLEVDAALAVGHIRLPKPLLRLAFGVERLLMRRFDQIVTISTKMQTAIERKGVPAERLVLVRNWVDVERIRPLGTPNGYREELGLQDRFVCLYSGQIGRKQALHLVLDAAESLQDDARFAFVIAGDGPERESLQQRYGALPNVRFLPLQPETRLPEFLNLADCHMLPQDAGMSELVLPSKLGGMLASGKRILVTADPDSELAEFLQASATIVAPGSPSAIVEGLLSLIQARDTTQAARLALARTISATDSLDRFAALLGKLAGSGRRKLRRAA
ncbi:WcaI family glycosyltransferase [Sphingomonas crusticola]|uniref:WcaI family glycosyltransferase n=1 Tax=Sphingomonas crusticola TaxID=1697973 RepID=UPI0013C2C9C6|nr:WcaI family glycosyltransferase [Sphingomonas crusticola]